MGSEAFMQLGLKLNGGQRGQWSPLYFYVRGGFVYPVPVYLVLAGQATNCKSMSLICSAVLE